MRGFVFTGVVVIVSVLIIVAIAYAWGFTAHKFINRKAAQHLPGEMNSFKADSLFYESHSVDADIRRDNTDTSFYAERWRHFLDIDDYPNYHNLPRDLNVLITLYGWERVKQNGLNPWVTQRLVDSLTAQLMRSDLTTAKYTMSDLGHYIADAHQPLHCTENYDGQFTGNNGIHSRYETSMINTYQSQLRVFPDSTQYISSPLDYAFEYIYHSNSLVDSVLAADDYAKAISGWNGSGTPPSSYYSALWQKTQSFTLDQFQHATVAIASLWYTAWFNAGLSTDVKESMELFKTGFSLLQNYPNPFNPVTHFRFEIGDLSLVSFKVFNFLGQEIETIVNSQLPAGSYEVVWNAEHLPSGVYFYRLEVGAHSKTRKMILVQ
ncbi:MAG: T9SS type A sorting domain-containing protein [Ignavibacteriae bacterium]|nr:T9SS type A sorting domain-containing protein [Ignavibacteriota bacterium]